MAFRKRPSMDDPSYAAMLLGKISVGLIVLAAAALIMSAVAISPVPASAKVITLPKDSADYIPNASTRVPLAAENLVFDGTSATLKKDTTDNCLYLLLPKPTNSTIKTVYDDPCTLSFPHATAIGRRDIDITVHISSVVVWPRWSKATDYEDSSYFSFGRLIYGKKSFEVGSWTNQARYRYHGTIEVDMEFTITWSDTGETVELPFIDAAYDLDQPTNTRSVYDPTFQKGYAESFEPVSGFTGNYYVFPSSDLLTTNNRFQANSNASLDGNSSWYRAAVIAPTTNGYWTARYFTSDSGTFISLYSSYLGLEHPVKNVDSSRFYHEGDEVEYTVSQKIGVWHATYASYQSFGFEDYIPKGLTYKSFYVTDGNGKDVTMSGRAVLDRNTRRFSYEFGKTWLSNPANYAGQTITWHIICKVDKPTALSSTIKNVGTTIFTGEYYDTNEVSITVHQQPLLTVKKKVPASCIQSEEKPIPFIFSVTGASWTRYGFATIDPSQSPDKDGFIVATCTFDNIPEDTYTVRELPVSRYTATAISGGTVKNGSTTLNLSSLVKATTVFTNEKTNDSDFSDKSAVINHFKCIKSN